MPQMDYTRRPFLAGNNLKRTANATVRGSIRRNDADGSYNAAYFPGVTASQTLLVTTQSGSYTVTFSTVVTAGLDYNQAITSINGALTGATAADFDGVLSITSTASGAAGLVSVTGGTAAAALGFDVTLGSITSVGGEISSSPEGRIGNLYGTAFPTSGENFGSDMFSRGMARLSSNLDVLHADSQREDTVLQKIGTLSADATGKYVALNSTTRVFNGFGTLSASSTPEELGPHFVLLDPTTKRPLGNRVVSVVISPASIITDPPYSNAANTTDTGKNVLGLNLIKLASTAISNIKPNQIVTCTGAGTAASVGDVAGISGATNTNPWANNGTKWVVEKIIDANNVMLRPMSKAELNQYSVTLTEIQPVLELNTSNSGSYGNLTLSTGMYTAGVALVVRPVLSAAQSVEVWASQPLTNRAASIGIKAISQFPFANNRRIFRSASDSDTALSVQAYSATMASDIFEVRDGSSIQIFKVSPAGGAVSLSRQSGVTGLVATGNGNAAGLEGDGGASGPGVRAIAGGGNSPVTGSLNLTPTTNAPTVPINGDLWVTTAGVLGAKVNGNVRTLAFLEASQTWTAAQTFSAAPTFSAGGSFTGATIPTIAGTPSGSTDITTVGYVSSNTVAPTSNRVAKAWAHINVTVGGTVTVQSSFNISGTPTISSGSLVVAFSTSVASSPYSITANQDCGTGAESGFATSATFLTFGQSTSGFSLSIYGSSGSKIALSSPASTLNFSFVVFAS